MKKLNQSNESKFRKKLNEFWSKHPKLLKALKIVNKVLSVLFIAFCIFLAVLMGRACFGNSSKSTIVASADTLVESINPSDIYSAQSSVINSFASTAYSSECYIEFGSAADTNTSQFYLAFIYNTSSSLKYDYSKSTAYSLIQSQIPVSNQLPFTSIGNLDYTGVTTLYTVSAPYFYTSADRSTLHSVDYYYGKETSIYQSEPFDYFALQGTRNSSFSYHYVLNDNSSYLCSVSLPTVFQINNNVYYKDATSNNYVSYNYTISFPCSRVSRETNASVKGSIVFFVCCTSALYTYDGSTSYYIFDPWSNVNNSASSYYSLDKQLTSNSPTNTYTLFYTATSGSIFRPYSGVILRSYSTLYDLPYIQIIPSALSSAFYDKGYSDGYADGYDAPSKLDEFWALRWADQFLSYKWFGSFSFGSFIAIAIAVAFAIMFLKFFSGG